MGRTNNQVFFMGHVHFLNLIGEINGLNKCTKGLLKDIIQLL